MSVIYKREREVDLESRSAPSYTIRRFRTVPVSERGFERTYEDDIYEEQRRIVRRERTPSPPAREVREVVVERDTTVSRAPRSEARSVREIRYIDRSPSPSHRSVHEIRIEHDHHHHGSRSSSPPSRRGDYIIEREVEREHDHHHHHAPYELERYSKSTEFFSRPDPPQPQQIVIRNEIPQPVVVREPARPQQIIVQREAPTYDIVERVEYVDDDRRLRHHDDYYFERKVREVDSGGRIEERSFDEREHRRRGRSRDHERSYSDDDVLIVRKEKDTWERDSSPHHRRHLAEGVIAGVGAAQLIRHHRKKQGENPGGAVRSSIGYGALGAVGAEAISRFRKSRSKSRSSSREGRHRHRQRGRSRSRSLSRGKALAGVAAIAGIGALAYAAGKRGKNQAVAAEQSRSRSRSKSRRRRHSISGATGDELLLSNKHDAEHRNRRVAQVGLASAAVAGLMERQRSKSRKGRSKSRIRTGAEVAAAGMAGAAVAGLYENRKAKKEGEVVAVKTRSRSRSVGSRHRDSTLVEYGGGNIYIDDTKDSHRHHRSHSRGSRSRSHHRRRRSSSSSSGRSRSRSHSRKRNIAETAAIAGVAGIAAHEAAKRREKKKAEKEQKRRAEEGTLTDDRYPSPVPPENGYGSHYPPPPSATGRYYPETNEFPPPPTADYGPPPPQGQPIYNQVNYNQAPYSPQPYNPAEYSQQPGPPPAANYGYGAPLPRDADPYEQRYRRGDENV